MKTLALASAVGALALAGLWNAGETHRANCLQDDRTGCSVLPWDAGQRVQTSRAPCDALTDAQKILNRSC